MAAHFEGTFDDNGFTFSFDQIDEDQAMRIVWALESRFDWVASLWSMRDVQVYHEENGAEWAESDIDLTPQEQGAVCTTYEWRKGINEAASEHVADVGLIPSVERHEDGSFTVHTIDGADRYLADGSPFPKP